VAQHEARAARSGAKEFFTKLESPFILDDPATQAPRGFRTLVQEAGIRSVVMLSITWRSELKGLLYFVSLRDAASTTATWR